MILRDSTKGECALMRVLQNGSWSQRTASWTATTSMKIAGIPTISIMKITGHKKEKAFLRNIRISREDNALKLIEHPF